MFLILLTRMRFQFLYIQNNHMYYTIENYFYKLCFYCVVYTIPSTHLIHQSFAFLYTKKNNFIFNFNNILLYPHSFTHLSIHFFFSFLFLDYFLLSKHHRLIYYIYYSQLNQFFFFFILFKSTERHSILHIRTIATLYNTNSFKRLKWTSMRISIFF